MQSLPDIAGGATKRASWTCVVMPRACTNWQPTTATLEPIGTSVLLQAATAEDALRVWGGSALTMTVDVDGTPVRRTASELGPPMCRPMRRPTTPRWSC